MLDAPVATLPRGPPILPACASAIAGQPPHLQAPGPDPIQGEEHLDPGQGDEAPQCGLTKDDTTACPSTASPSRAANSSGPTGRADAPE